jgi:hypothetical protein
MKPYRPNVELAKKLYSLRFSLDGMRRGKPPPGKRIQSNSTPWIENPRTLEDVEYISDRIAQTVEQWKAKGA